MHIPISDVYYVPGLNRNLLSLGLIEKKGYSYEGKNGFLCIYNPKGQLFLKVRNENSLYPVKGCKSNLEFNSNIVGSKDNSLNLWHKRCAHIGAGTVYSTVNSELVLGVSKIEKEQVNCYDCIEGKLKRGPFKRIKGIITKKPFQMVHADLWGPAPVDSKGGAKYFLGIVDDYSRYLAVFPLKSKNESVGAIVKYVTSVERQQNHKLLAIRTDNALDFCNREMKEFCDSQGIKHQLSNAYSPEMMGTAEKINYDSMDAVRTLLVSSKLGPAFWAEALQCYVHVKNRVRHSVDLKTTPYEKFHGKKPNISHFRVFGSLCFFHVPKVTRNKLQPKSKKGILVGYAARTKGYRVFDPDTNKVIELKHVKIDESVNGVDVVNLKSRFVKKSSFTDFVADDISEDSEFDELDDSVKLEVSKIKDNKEIESKVETPNASSNLDDWTRKEVKRKMSDRIDVYYYAPDKTRCRSINDVRKYATATGTVVCEDLFNFKPTLTHPTDSESQSGCDSDESENSNTPEIMAFNLTIPQSYEDVVKSKYRNKWENAMKEELKTIESRDVWDIVDRPKNQKIITSRWVYSVKNNVDGSIKRFKARLVAHGHKQRMGIDYDSNTYSPVVDFSLIKLFFVMLVIVLGWKHQHYDVKCAYLYSPLDENIFMEMPIGYLDYAVSDKVLKLKKSLYGLKQSGKNWHNHLTKSLLSLGFTQSSYCPCLFISYKCVIICYVDDLAVFCEDDQYLNNVYLSLSSLYEIVNLGPITKILGVQFQNINGQIFMHQHAYIEKLIKNFPVDLTVPVYTPMEVGLDKNLLAAKDAGDYPFKELLGSLLFLANRTRADILFPVIFAAQFSSRPNLNHWRLLLRILKYVCLTRHYCINLSTAINSDFVMFTDASWATAADSRRSISGFIWSIGNVFLGWRSCTQKCIAKSAMESEYVALDAAATEAFWLSNVLNECKFLFSKVIPLVLCDNQAAICFSERNAINNRTKHIDVRYNYVKNLVEENCIVLKYVSTQLNVADMLTKPLLKDKLYSFVKQVFVNIVNGGTL